MVLGCLTPRFSFAFWEREQLTLEDESIYNYLQVRDTPESTILSTNVLFGVQSIKMKEEGLTGLYYDYALAAPVMAGMNEKADSQVMILGLGIRHLRRLLQPDISRERGSRGRRSMRRS